MELFVNGVNIASATLALRHQGSQSLVPCISFQKFSGTEYHYPPLLQLLKTAARCGGHRHCPNRGQGSLDPFIFCPKEFPLGTLQYILEEVDQFSDVITTHIHSVWQK